MAELPSDSARRLWIGSPPATPPSCVEETPAGLHELVQIALLSLAEDAARAAVSLEFDLACDAGVGLDPERLEAVLIALASDAILAMPAGGRLRVECRREGEWLVLSLRDSGVRIADVPGDPLPPEARRRPEDRPSVGWARSFVAACRGQLEVGKEEGAGAAVHLRLPLSPAA